MQNQLKRIIVLFVLLIVWGCAKEEDLTTTVPYASVNIVINTISDNAFETPYHHKLYNNEGYAGVIVISNTDASMLYAFDLCCPYEAPSKNKLNVKNAIQLECPSCKTVYNLDDGLGRPDSGPGNKRLKRYYGSKDGKTYRFRN